MENVSKTAAIVDCLAAIDPMITKMGIIYAKSGTTYCIVYIIVVSHYTHVHVHTVAARADHLPEVG